MDRLRPETRAFFGRLVELGRENWKRGDKFPPT